MNLASSLPVPHRALLWMGALLICHFSGGTALAQPSSTNTITGTISVPGERDVLTFNLANRATYYFDSLTNVSTLHWSLEGPGGTLVNNRSFNVSDAGNASVLSLWPGFYRLTVHADGTNTPGYAFRLMNLTSAPLLTPDTVVSNALAPGNETKLYQLPANAGDRFLFDRLFVSPGQSVWWRLLDPYGNEVFTTPFNDVGTVTQQVTGTYTLLVEGYITNDRLVTNSFRVTSQGTTAPTPLAGTPVALGEIVGGSLTNLATNAFTFTLAAETRVIFDTLTNSPSVQWFLEGPPGPAFLFVNNQGINSSDGLGGSTVLELPMGNYQLRVRRNTAGTAPYRFRLLDLNTAAGITPGTPVSGSLLPRQETDLYQFNVVAGSRYFFDTFPTNGPPNAHWRLIDPMGGIVASAGLTTDRGPNTLTVPGTYTLSVEGYFDQDTGNPGYGFNIVPVSDGAQTVTLGALTSGSIGLPGQAQRYLFSLGAKATLYFDSRTNNGQLRWSLDGPTGNRVNNRAFTASDGSNLDDALLPLVAGDYILTVTGNGDVTGGFAFRLLDLASASPMTPGMPVTGTLSPANETDLYRFTVAAGTKVYFDAVNSSSLPNGSWRCINPYGDKIFPGHPNYLADVGPVVLAHGGTYTVLVEGQHSDPGSGAYTINVVPVNDGAQALAVGDLVTGAIAAPGQSQVYRFTLPTAAAIYFDSLTNNGSLRWSLQGATGTLVNNRTFIASDALNLYGVLNLGAGDYTLTVNASSDNTGGYQFRLIDLATAAPLTPGVPVAGTLNPANETKAYRFALPANSRVYFDWINQISLPNVHWRCVDPYGRIVLDNRASDLGPLTVAAGGIYTLLVEGYHSDPNSGNYTFNVVPVNDGAQEIAVGSVITGAVTLPGQVQVYHFTLPAAANLYFDAQTASASLRWALDGPAGRLVANRAFTQSDAHNLYSVLNLPPGAYTITVDASTDTLGAFQFRLLDLATAAPLTPGTPVGGTLDPANETEAYRFSVSAGTKVYFDSLTSSGLLNTYWRCIDPSGEIVLANAFTDLGPVVLAEGGTYTLLIEGHHQNSGSGSFTFNILPVNDGVQLLTLGSVVTGAVTVPGQTQFYNFTLLTATTLYFDSLTNISQLRWSLDGPSGKVVNNRAFSQSDAQNITDPLLTLPPGNYTLSIAGSVNGEDTGGFRFRLFDIASAAVVMPGNPVNASLDPGNETDAYRFNATAGDRFAFNWITQSGIQNSYWRLFDPFGNQLFGLATDNAGTNRLLATGSYTLLVEGHIADPANGSYQFNVAFVDNVPVSFAGTPLVPGATINGNLPNATTANAFTFTLASPARLFFDSLANSAVTWSLTGPPGNLVVNRTFISSDSFDANPRLDLPAGDYRLTVRGVAGSYSFRLLDAAAATAFTPGLILSNSIVPARGTALYRFDATAGDRFYYDGRPRTGFTSEPYVRLYSPFGDLVLNQQQVTTDVDVFAVPHTGTYLLAVEGRYVDAGAQGSFSLLLQPVVDATNTFAIGDTVNGSITMAGQRQFHRFSLPSSRRLFFDSLTSQDFTWSLSGPPGVVVEDRRFNSSDSFDQNSLLILPAGDYQIEVDASNADMGGYSFRLLDALTAANFIPGTLVTNSLTPGISTRLYQFTAAAGDRFYFDGRPRSGFTHSPYVRIYSPFDDVVLNQQDATTDADPFAVPYSGLYLLAVEGRYADTSTNGNFSFNLLPILDGTNTFAIGATVSGAIVVPGQRQFHFFSLPAPSRLLFDSLANSSFTWTLTGPPGVIVNKRALYSSDSFEENALLNLPAGDYGIEVDANTAETGDYAFRLVDSSSAAPFTPGLLVNGSLTPGNSTAVFRFNAAAGDRFYFDGRPRTGFTAQPYVRLYSPAGQIVLSQQGVSDDADPFSVPHAGSYLLSVEGRYLDTSPSGTFSFVLQPVVDATNNVTVGTTINGTLAVSGQRQFHRFSLAAPTRLIFDSLVDSAFTWTLAGPSIENFTARRFDSSDSYDGDPLLDLPAGDFLITVDASGASAGNYAFRLLEAASALSFNPGTLVSGELAPARSTLLYQFNATAGERFYYDGRPAAGFATAPYSRLLSPSGKVLLAANLTFDVESIVALESGTYLATVEGRATDNNPGGNFAFSYIPNPPQPPMPLFDTNVAPDLRVTGVAVNPPSGLQSGQSATVTWTTRNDGTAGSSGSFTERVTVRNTATSQIIVNRTLLHDEAVEGPINPGQTRLRALSITLPDGLPGAGNLEVTATTDVLNNIFEQNGAGTAEANNAASININSTLALYPDLRVASLEVAPLSGWLTGQTVTVSWVITNTGSRATAGSWSESLVVRNTNTSQVIVNATTTYDAAEPGNGDIAPSGFRNRTLNFTVPNNASAYGAFEVTITTDSDNAIFEFVPTAGIAEINNSRSLVTASAPDLVVNGLNVTADPGLQAGAELTVEWNTANHGNVPADGVFYDRVLIRNTNTAEVLFNSALPYNPASAGNGAISPGTSRLRQQVFQLPEGARAVGRLEITVSADTFNQLVEHNDNGTGEANNSSRIEAVVAPSPYPDLVVTNISGPVVGQPGQRVPFVWTIRNLGTVPAAGSWSDQLFLSSDSAVGNDQFLAAVGFSGTLNPGQSLTRTQQVTLPSFGTGNRYFVAEVDAGNVVFEEVETNNAAVAQAATVMPAALGVTLSPATVSESAGSQAVVVTLTRNSDVASALVVTLAHDQPAKLIVPPTVTIPFAAPSTNFFIQLVDDTIADSNVIVTLTAQAAGHTPATNTLAILENDTPRLTLRLSAPSITEGAAPGTVTGSVTRNAGTNGALTVMLTSDRPGVLAAPLSVIIPPGQTNVSFNLDPEEDDVVTGTRPVTIYASAAGFGTVSAPISVLDDDSVALTLQLSDTTVVENKINPAAVATLTRSPISSALLRVRLGTNGGGGVQLPPEVIIPANQPAVSFNVTVLDDHLAFGGQTVNLVAEGLANNGSPIPGALATASLTVLENDGPTLFVAAAAAVIEEGTTTIVTVTRNTPATNALTVSLSAAPSSQITLPASVVIDLGQSSTNITINGISDGVSDGLQEVTITAGTPGFNPGNAQLTVTDIDVPDFTVIEVSAPTNALTDASISVVWSVTNSGLATATGTWVDEVYLAKDSQGANATLVLAVTNQGPIVVGDTYSVSRSFRLPPDPGNYWVVIRSDAGNTIGEGSERNNTGVSAALAVQPAYRATVTTDVDAAVSGTPIPLTGRTFFSADGSPAPFRSATVRVLVNQTRRTFSVLSDASGNFSGVFRPIPGEAGLYTVGADHPRVMQDAAQDQFTLLGMAAVPWELNIRLAPNVPVTGRIDLRNLSPLPLTGLIVSPEGLPLDFNVTTTTTNQLAGHQTNSIDFEIVTSLTTPVRGRFHLLIASAEGASLRLPVDFTVTPPTAQLVAEPGTLDHGMLRGTQTLVQFDVVNQGGVGSGDLTVALPVVPWMSLVSTSPIPSLPPGGRSTLVLALSPAADLPLTRYDGTMVVHGGNAGVTVPFHFRALSEARGDLLLTVTDEHTYYATGAPRVTNAVIELRDPITSEVVTNGISDANGEVRFNDLPEGTYRIEASASRRSPSRGGVRVVPGVTTEQEVFMLRQEVTYEWSVVPSVITDHYRVVLQPQFEAEVPQPNLVVESPVVTPLIFPGQVSQFAIRLRNNGLISLLRVRIPVPSNPNYIITPLVTEIEELPAQTSISVPVTIRVRESGGGGNGGFQAASAPGCPGDDCVIQIPIDTRFRCGNNFVARTANVTLHAVCVPNTGCDFSQFLDTSSPNFFNESVLAHRAEWDCLLGNMDECDKARVRGYLRSGDFGSVHFPPGALPPPLDGTNFGLSAFCVCGPQANTNSIFIFGTNYLNILNLTNTGTAGTVVSFVSATVPGPCNAPGPAPFQPAAAAPGAGVCARVRLELSQDAAMTRAAFRGTLILQNGGVTDLTDIQLVLDFRDGNNQPAGGRFAVRGPTLSGITAIDGSGTVAGGTSGSVEYVFIPTLEAAPLAPAVYSIGGTLRFTLDGQALTVPLLPGQITVLPDARLQLEYFQQRDVFSDDPFTPELEPAEPFALGLRINNTGAGIARNFQISSAAPRIIDNEKGLVIDFKLLGATVDNQPLPPSFNLSLGDINPDQSRVVVWDMTSTLQGKFIDYRASFVHLDAFGATSISLIESVNLHEMIHVVRDVRPGADALPDFLVNDQVDPDNLPDIVYLSTGTNEPVALGGNAVVDSPPSPEDLVIQLTASMPAGWAYLRTTNPGPDFRLVSARRSDGTLLRIPENVWTTDRTFPSSIPGAIREKTLHLFDHDSTGAYTLTFSPIAQDTNPPTSAVASLPAASPASFALAWSGDDAAGGSGIAFFDIYVSVNGGPFTNWLAHTTQGSALFDGVIDNTYAFYSRATDLAGNEEIAPASADAQTVASGVNTQPTLVPIGDTTIDEGAAMGLLATAIDTDVPRQSLNFTLLTAPVGATIDAAAGFIQWPTGESHGGTSNRFTIVVTDNGQPSLSATQSFSVTVRELNAAPFFVNAEPDLLVDEESILGHTVAASDADQPANQLTWQLGPGAPAGLTLDPNTGLLNWTPGETDGPGEYPVSVTVRDNGSPMQSVTRTLRIVVREINRAPALAPIPTRATLVLTTLTITNSATDPDLPAQEFFYSLAPGGPRGARVDRDSGVFTWTPSADYARSTNTFTVRATDNGVPSLTGSQTFTVVVGDYLELRLGSAIVLAGQTSSVPISVFTTVPATNVNFVVELPLERLTNFSLVPPVPPLASATVQALGGNRYQVALGALSGLDLAGEQTISHLRFTALSNRVSAFVPLLVSNVVARQVNGQPVPRSLGKQGRAAYLGRESLLEMTQQTNHVELIVYGPASHYRVESALSLGPSADWVPFWTGPVNDLVEVIPLSPTNRLQFFRAVEDAGMRFTAVTSDPLTHEVRLTLSVIPGRSYELQRSSDLINWTPFATNHAAASPLIVIDAGESGLKQRFYRAQER